jgi:hypothetical protein
MLARKEADGRFPQFQETGHRAEHSNVELDVLYVGEFDFQTVSAAASVTEIHSPSPSAAMSRHCCSLAPASWASNSRAAYCGGRATVTDLQSVVS